MLPKTSLKAGEKFSLFIHYTIEDPDTGLRFFGPSENEPDVPYIAWSQGESIFNSNWIPCFDHPNERQTTEMIVTTKRGYEVSSNGRLLSNQGETIIQTRTGVQYALRFGEIALGETATGDLSGSADETDESSSEANRYLFVTADFNPDLIPEPQLAELPEIPAATQPQGSALEEAMQEARERVDQENLRKQEEYQESLDAGRQKVSQLNDRFADWFYVISDSVYNKIRLTRADVVAQIDEETKDAPTTQPGDGSDAG